MFERFVSRLEGEGRRRPWWCCRCLLILALTAGVARGASPPQQTGASAQAVLAQAQESLRRGDAEGASRILSAWTTSHPKDSAARLALATVLAKLHRYKEAAVAVAGVPAPADRGQRIFFERLKASIDLGTGDAKGAARDMERASELAPDDPDLQLAAGMAEVEAGAWRAAAARLGPVFAAGHNPQAGAALLQAEVATRADHSSTLKELDSLDLPVAQRAPLRAHAGEILAQGGFSAEAAKEFEKAIADSPRDAALYYDLALAQFNAGQLDAALEATQQAKALADSAALESLRGDIQDARGQDLDAVHSYQAAVAMAPDQEQYRLTLGLDLLRHETFEPALTVFKQAAELFPKSSHARMAEGLTYYFLEQYPQAIKTLLAASQIDPRSKLPLDYLGDIQLQTPVTPDPAAIREICRYADAHPGAGGELAYCGALQLRIEHDRGDPAPSAETVERLRLAARRAPSDATARCSLGQALEWSRQWQKAEDEMEACLRLNPDSVEDHYRMANIARRLGQNERVQQELKLHDEAQKRLVESNAARDRTLKKFLYTMASESAKGAKD